MATRSSVAIATLVFALLSPFVHAESFLGGRKASLRASLDSGNFQNDIRGAMDEALGCGGHIGERQLGEIQAVLAPIWTALPKTNNGRIERRSLRYLAHRYFNSRSALMIRGFEPSRPVNQSDWGNADILSQRVPSYVESVLESQHAQEHGFDLRDAVRLVATLEELIFDSEGTLLESVYSEQRKPTTRSLSDVGLAQVLESYMVHWMLGGDEEAVAALLKDPKLRAETFPHWNMVVDFTKGQVRAMQYKRYHEAQANSRPNHNAMAPRYTFEDAHQVVGGITKSFASFWESECRSMTATLVEMDKHNTGRVPLSKFYGSALDAEWRFGESEAYLRELGALDETSGWRGKQVIIPNYIAAASNCIVSAPHYLVCCISYCETILSEIEGTVGAPTATAKEILALVGNMTSQTTLEHEDPPNLQGTLTTQLEQIAEAHGGKVPLHGRLFAQWLHYTFPRECPFPQKTGSVAIASPYEFGNSALATDDEMKEHSRKAESDTLKINRNEEEWMSQWTSEEELIADYGADLRAPWDNRRMAVVSAVSFIFFSVLGIFGASLKTSSSTAGGALLPTHGKAHFV